ncbi:MAG: NAD(P)-dependent alcohol dehydrogenase [bacterium]|nr:NAD(P)-dependent alcohol dehydrogenase [bacterium]
MHAYRLFADGPRLVDDLPITEPREGEILVKIAGAGACHSDLHVIEATAAGKSFFTPPFTLGHENTGWVEAVGPGVRNVALGEAVAIYCAWGCGRCRACLISAENYCERQALLLGGGLGRDGGMATHMIVPAARYLVPLGDLEPRDAAPLTDAGLTPYHAVKRALPLLAPDATALVVGIGGLGHMALQILRALTSARVIAVDLSEARLASARELGADQTVVADEHALERVREITHGAAVDVAFDFVGAQSTIDLARKLVRADGEMLIVGLGGGVMPYAQGKIAWGARVSTPFYGSIAELREVIALAARGRLHAHVTRFSLDRVADAYRALHDGTLDGRAVITPNG